MGFELLLGVLITHFELTYPALPTLCFELNVLILGKEVVNISSFGSLQHFKKEKKPLLATDRLDFSYFLPFELNIFFGT